MNEKERIIQRPGKEELFTDRDEFLDAFKGALTELTPDAPNSLETAPATFPASKPAAMLPGLAPASVAIMMKTGSLLNGNRLCLLPLFGDS